MGIPVFFRGNLQLQSHQPAAYAPGLADAGEFPKPIKISKGCTAWFEREIDEMLEAKRLARDAER